MSELTEPKCPSNNFGKGPGYVVPQTDEAISEWEKMWDEWESAHPDDPTGEKALAKWEDYVRRAAASTAMIHTPDDLAHTKPIPKPVRELRYNRDNKEKFRFYIPVELHEMLKRKCNDQGRAMSNVVQKLIESYLQS